MSRCGTDTGITKAGLGKNEKGKKQNIQVCVRVRPMNGAERKLGGHSVVKTDAEHHTIQVKDRLNPNNSKTFPAFDKVYGPNSTQLEIYQDVVGCQISEVLQGYNCTIFAYGQTGTGKTFTMEGEKSDDPALTWESDPLSGIVPRSLQHLFDKLESIESEYSVRVSYVELYNEELYDLLGPSEVDTTTRLRIYEDTMRKGSVIVQGCEERLVRNRKEVYDILEKGALKRQTAATLLNAHSSRSHSVFTITVHLKESTVAGEELLKTGKLNLVDLAGSENIGRSGAIEKRAREAGNINQSLLTLGRVITALVERAPHVPYRESKLTRLLQDSLGGRTITTIIATLSPSSTNLEETVSTLEYATRAKNIKNHPEVNQKLTRTALIKEYSDEIERLRRDMVAAREKNGIYLAQENYEAMQQDIARKSSELEEMEERLEVILDQLSKRKEELAEMSAQQERTRQKLMRTRGKLQEKKDKLRDTRFELAVTERDRNYYVHLLDERIQTEALLFDQATQLLEVSEKATVEVEGLHQKLERKTKIEETNMQQLMEFAKEIDQRVLDASLAVENLHVDTQTRTQAAVTLSKSIGAGNESHDGESSRIVGQLAKEIKEKLETLKKELEKNKTDNGTVSQNLTTTTADMKEYLAKTLSEWSETVEKSVLKTKENMDEVTGTAEQQKKDMTEMMRVRECRVKKYCNQETLITADFEKKVREEDAAQNQRFDKVAKGLSEVKEERNEMAEIRRKLEERDNKLDETIKELTSLLVEVKTNQAKLPSVVEEFTASTSNTRIEFKDEILKQDQEDTDSLANSCNLIVSSNVKTAKFLDEFSADALKKHESTAETVTQICDAVAKTCQTQMTTFDAQWTSSEDAVTKVQNYAEQTTETLVKNSTEWLSSTSVALSKNETSLKKGEEKVEEWSEDMRGKVTQLKTSVEDLLARKIEHDQPTGGTPKPHRFVYPRRLVQTRPIEEILAEYNKTTPQVEASQLNETADTIMDDSSFLLEVPEEETETTSVEREEERNNTPTNDNQGPIDENTEPESGRKSEEVVEKEVSTHKNKGRRRAMVNIPH